MGYATLTKSIRRLSIMSKAPPFDAESYIKRMIEAGFTQQQAEALAELHAAVGEALAQSETESDDLDAE